MPRQRPLLRSWLQRLEQPDWLQTLSNYTLIQVHAHAVAEFSESCAA